MTVDIIHEGGGCEAIARQEGSELKDLEVHIYLCSEKATHTAVFRDGRELPCCGSHGAMWLDLDYLADLVPL